MLKLRGQWQNYSHCLDCVWTVEDTTVQVLYLTTQDHEIFTDLWHQTSSYCQAGFIHYPETRKGSPRVKAFNERGPVNLDPLPTFIVKEFTDVLMLTAMGNASMTMGCFPSSRKAAIVVTGLKKAGLDPFEMKNYRPFSNLSLRKLMSILSHLYI